MADSTAVGTVASALFSSSDRGREALRSASPNLSSHLIRSEQERRCAHPRSWRHPPPRTGFTRLDYGHLSLQHGPRIHGTVQDGWPHSARRDLMAVARLETTAPDACSSPVTTEGAGLTG